MTKEEILEQSRKENNSKDMFDFEVQKTALVAEAHRRMETQPN